MVNTQDRINAIIAGIGPVGASRDDAEFERRAGARVALTRLVGELFALRKHQERLRRRAERGRLQCYFVNAMKRWVFTFDATHGREHGRNVSSLSRTRYREGRLAVQALEARIQKEHARIMVHLRERVRLPGDEL